MNYSTTIRSITSALLIIVFALSITPVAILHSLSANHKDKSFANKNLPGDQFAKAGINCNIADFVAEAQFYKAYTSIVFSLPKTFTAVNTPITVDIYTRAPLHTTLRGPPVTAV